VHRLGYVVLAAVLPAALAAPPAASSAEQSVALVVTDAEGAFVGDLRKEEVQVLENGEARELVGFSRDRRPLAVALVLDSSDSAAGVFRVHAYDAVSTFLAALPAGSRCTLWTTGDRPRRLGALEGDAAAVDKKVGQAFAFGGANTLLDALVEAGQDLERASGRRRALVAVASASSGYSGWTPREVFDRVRRAGARILSVQYSQGAGGPSAPAVGLSGPRDANSLTMVGSSDHERMLASLGRATGGRFESVGAALGVRGALAGFARDLEGQYRLRYVSASGKGPRRVEVRLARTGLRWSVVVDSP
jgi:VWFA-related protein